MPQTDPTYRGIVVSHTHWDRAWYLPFESFRPRLVRLVDRLLDLLEDNPAYRAFTLDGQTVLLEDYLDVRPDQEERLRRMIEDGRLLIGPWYTLPDLFLVSGEAVIRNLQEGHRMCEAYGGAMPVGYIPDPFGHFAQMPQLLRGFGLDTYIFMRGLDRETKERLGAVFHWEAPDGSRVRAVYQRKGYFPAAALGHPDIYGRFDGHAPKPRLAKQRLRDAVKKMAPLQEEQTLLLSNGFDHMPEQPELPSLLRDLNEQIETLTLEHGTLPGFVEALHREKRDHGVFQGDLLGNADHPILSSVYSTRMYLKQQNHRAQQLLTRYAEPMSAWLDAEDVGPDARPLLRHAWKKLMRNHPHDDICGCSVDAVHEDDEVRFRQVIESGTSLLVEHLEHLLTEDGFQPPADTGPRASDVWVFNPHPFRRTYRVETTILIPNTAGKRGPVPPVQELSACTGDGASVDVTILETEDDVMRNEYLEQTWGRRYRIAFDVEVPPLGYQLVHVYEDGPPDPSPTSPRVPNGRPLLKSDRYRVTIEDRSVVLVDKDQDRRIDDVLRYEYQLDAGDTYSFGPVPDHGPWWATLDTASVHPTRPDALRLRHVLSIPAAYDRDEGPAGTTQLTITTDLVLGPHRALEIDVQYENTAENGRLRAVLPANATTRSALVDGHFRLAEREKPPQQTPESHPQRYEAYPGELTYPTHHQGDFALVEGDGHRTWLANRGLPEIELLHPDGDTHFAVTLHRAVDKLSVQGGRIRRCQAGPTVPTPGAQCKRTMHAALAYGTGAVSRNNAVRHARAFAHPAWAREMPFLPYIDSDGDRPRAAGLLALDNPALELSAFAPAPHEGTQTLRLYNRSGVPQDATVTLGFDATAWCPTDLHEQWEAAAARPIQDRTLDLVVPPHTIRTILVR
jgi:mannosylglycerate hydrolase